MIAPNILLIVVAEIAVLLLVVCIVLIFQNRSLRNLVNQLKEKAQGVIRELKKTRQELAEAEKAAESATPESDGTDTAASLSYLDYVDEEISKTLEHHGTLNSNQPIALDIEPGTPLPFRTAALRHAIMMAEKEAFGRNKKLDWQVLRERYDQLFRYHDEFEPESNNDDYDELHTELQNAKKRISNLERFKQLYFDLEEQWNNSKNEAKTAFDNLTTIASELDDSGRLESAINDYNESYNGLSELFGSVSDEGLRTAGEGVGVSEEVKHLRTVAADQHRIIEGLQKQLMNVSSNEERESVVNGLQNELQKQARFIQESETCIQLLEDELNTANSELERLRQKANQISELKTDLVGMRKYGDELELKYHSALSENRMLQKQLKELVANSGSSVNDEEASRLKKELSGLIERYNELEERYLDLKMQQ